MTSWLEYKDELTVYAKTIDKTIQLHSNNNWLFTVLSWIVCVFTLDKKTRDQFLNHTAITLANHHFYPPAWSRNLVERYILHEGQHTRQCRKMAAGLHPLLGLIPFLLVYFLLPFPVIYALGRFYLELEAKKVEWENMYRFEEDFVDVYTDAQTFLDDISGPAYFWAVRKEFAKKRILAALQTLIESREQ